MSCGDGWAVPYVCHAHGAELAPSDDGGTLRCPVGCSYPIRNGIARFVPSESYSAGFGAQWKHFAKTQLDSHSGVDITRARLTRLMGGSLDFLAGKSVLEAGCGAGRFTEILLDAGACVTSVDLSTAVEACRDNNVPHPNLRLAQASILDLPFPEGGFDVVACIGVVQHLPSSKEGLAALSRQLKPGGLLVFDHYPPEYAVTPVRKLFRRVFLKISPRWTVPLCVGMTGMLWPLHRLVWELKNRYPAAEKLYGWLLERSPLVDYQDSYPQLGKRMLREWAALDTHDTLTDAFKHLHDESELRAMLEEIGMDDIVLWRGGNGVEANASSRRSVAKMTGNAPIHSPDASARPAG